jgi:membrane dipeptidase
MKIGRTAAYAAVAVLALAMVSAPGAARGDAALDRAHKILRSTPLIDGHNDLPWTIREDSIARGDVALYDLKQPTKGHTDLARLRAGQVGAQFWSVYIPGNIPHFARYQLEQIDIAHRVIARYPDVFAIALTADDIERVYRGGRVASLLGVEGGHAIENSISLLRVYYDLGVRYMTITHNVTLDWADAALDTARHDGLTPFGEEVVREMNRLGMLVDLSHTSEATMDDVLRVTEAPVIFSHSSTRALANTRRNVPDSILRRLPENGGVVMVMFASGVVAPEAADSAEVWWPQLTRLQTGVTDEEQRSRISKEFWKTRKMPKATLAQVADHIEHVRDVAGVDHVGLGSDFDGTRDLPVGLEDVSKYPDLFAELIRRGWKDDDLRKLAGRNLLRVMREAESTSRRLQKERAPSVGTLKELDAY